MHWRSLLALAALLAAGPAGATWLVSADADLRAVLDGAGARGKLYAAGASVRKTFSDTQGDRWIAFILVEAESNLARAMVHQLYLRHKGPLGRWNLTAGRFGLPFGLLAGYSATRMPYETQEEMTLGFEADNGVMISGTLNRLEYGLSATQGLGMGPIDHLTGPGLGLARAGFALGQDDQHSIGITGAYGRTTDGHGSGSERLVQLAGLDLTMNLLGATARAEATVGSHRPGGGLTGIFSAADIPLIPKLDLNASASRFLQGGANHSRWYMGLAAFPGWATVRAGIRQSQGKEGRHEIVLQAYRLFSAAF